MAPSAPHMLAADRVEFSSGAKTRVGATDLTE